MSAVTPAEDRFLGPRVMRSVVRFSDAIELAEALPNRGMHTIYCRLLRLHEAAEVQDVQLRISARSIQGEAQLTGTAANWPKHRPKFAASS